MKAGKRIQYYGIGLLMGIAITFMMYKNKSCDWLPGNRVLSMLQSCTVEISDFRSCQLDCYGITEDDVFGLLESGEVDFSESQTGGDLKEYVLSNNQHKITFNINLKDSIAQVNRVLDANQTCDCSGRDEKAYSIMFKPNDMILKALQDNGFEITKINECQSDCYGIDTAFMHSSIIDGLVINTESFPQRQPNPIYTIQKMSGADTVKFTVEQGEKTRVLEMKINGLPKNCDCN